MSCTPRSLVGREHSPPSADDLSALLLLLAATRCACGDIAGRDRPKWWGAAAIEEDEQSARRWLAEIGAPLLRQVGARQLARLADRAARGSKPNAANLYVALLHRAELADAPGEDDADPESIAC